jgi:hypothetical protein
MDADTRAELIHDIASRAFTTKRLVKRWDVTAEDLRAFLSAHRPMVEAEARRIADASASVKATGEPTPSDLAELWITNKTERLERLQVIADEIYDGIRNGTFVGGAELAMAVREFRSYLTTAANELGQLMHRGSGDAGTGDTLNVNIEGVDMDSLR